MADSNGEDEQSPADDDLGAAVDEAMELEMKRQKARFIQQIMGFDRGEGVGRSDERWNESLFRELGVDRPDDPTG